MMIQFQNSGMWPGLEGWLQPAASKSKKDGLSKFNFLSANAANICLKQSHLKIVSLKLRFGKRLIMCQFYVGLYDYSLQSTWLIDMEFFLSYPNFNVAWIHHRFGWMMWYLW